MAFAEGKWAEREAIFNQQIEQLRALVAAHSEASAPSEGLPAEQEDAILLDEFEEDEAWNKVEPGKRKVLFGRQRDLLAKKVKAKNTGGKHGDKAAANKKVGAPKGGKAGGKAEPPQMG